MFACINAYETSLAITPLTYVCFNAHLFQIIMVTQTTTIDVYYSVVKVYGHKIHPENVFHSVPLINLQIT